jgi:hypothetical protein
VLDFEKLVQQIAAVDGQTKQSSSGQTIIQALGAFEEACAEPSSLLTRAQLSESLTLWPIAIALEPFGHKEEVTVVDADIVVVAIDGSQVMPSHHEVHSCFLLNIGVVRLAYGQALKPILESFPHLYHRSDELYPLVNRRRLHIDELYVSLERTLLELKYLSEFSLQAKRLGGQVIALMDGSLIPWSVEKMPLHYQEYFYDEWTNLLQSFETEKVPLVAYISNNRSSDIVNLLRIFRCPYELSDCRKHCRDLSEEDFPCSTVWPLSDRKLMAQILRRSERSGIFLSGAKTNKFRSGAVPICFCYLNVGEECARLEFPKWVMADEKLRGIAFGAILSQCNKGRGYPVALAEAHHLAVVRGQDRQRFFDMITRHLISKGVKQVGVSPKERQKRIGLV